VLFEQYVDQAALPAHRDPPLLERFVGGNLARMLVEREWPVRRCRLGR
jgi:quinol monooxygenase YgiN